MVQNFRGFLIAMILTGLFIIAIVSFNIQFQIDNNTNLSLTDNELVNTTFSGVEDQLSDFTENTTAQKNATEQDPTEIGSENVVLRSIWGSIKVFGSSIIGIANLIFALPHILGVSPIVTGTILAILVVLFIFLGWRAIRTGD